MPRKHRARSTKTHARHNKKDNYESRKIHEIINAIREKDLAALRHLGRAPGGFFNKHLRKQAWRLLLRYDEAIKVSSITATGTLENHKDEGQVALDVVRSFNTYPKAISASAKAAIRSKLTKVITHVLRNHPQLHYYQGFHDICSVFALVFDENDAGILMEQVALFYIRDAMLDSLEPILRQLTMVDTLIQKEDPALHDHIASWVITWFSHDLNDLQRVVRLFDVFLSSEPLMPLYMSAAVVLSQRKRVLAEESDMSMLHTLLTKAPKEQQNHHNLDGLEALIKKAMELETTYPPLTLQIESGVALDEVSATNMFDRLWLTSSDLALARTEADHVLSMTVDERVPLDLAAHINSRTNNNTHGQKVLERLRAAYLQDTALWSMVLLSAGVVALAVLTSNSDPARDWLTSLAYTYLPFHQLK